jgi:tRNA threonylcarbamoyladenosine biosynthesis protein TsaE
VPGARHLPSGSRALETGSAAQTFRLGEICGSRLEGPLVIGLFGDLGSGKTAFVQGLARGLGVPAGTYVTSPSYTLIHEYPGRIPLAHIDLYRLETAAAIEDLGLEEFLHADSVCAVEWAERLPPGSVSDRLEIHFEIGDEDRRSIRLLAYGQAALSLLKAVDHFYPDIRSGHPA